MPARLRVVPSIWRSTWAGTPPTSVCGGTSLVTTAPAATTAPRPDAHAVRDNRAAADPDVVFDDDALRRDALPGEGTRRVVINVIDSENLNERARVDAVADGDAALAAQHVQLADEGIRADADKRMGQVAKVVDMQHCPSHNQRPVADANAAGARVQVDAVIEVGSPA